MTTAGGKKRGLRARNPLYAHWERARTYKHTSYLDERPHRGVGCPWETGDVHTGDGIQRVSEEQPASLAPVWGEGGSVLQALGSKEEKARQRLKRRTKKKESYEEYLESSTWRKIRAAALRRDKNKCRSCGDPARVVHHVRYPEILGEEKMDWLYSLCRPCHDEIHRLDKQLTLRDATDLILRAGGIEKTVTFVPDDPQLSKAATRNRQLRRGWGKSKKKKRRKPPPADVRKRTKLQLANDRLHEEQKRARENRAKFRKGQDGA